MIRGLTTLLVMIGSSSGLAGELEIRVSENGNAQFPLVSLYADSEANSVPLATATTPGIVTYLGDGPVWLGLNGRSGRIGPLAAEARVEFGVLELLAPENATGRFGILGDDGAFFGVVHISEKLYLPVGHYNLRRDLGDAIIPVEISTQSATILTFGAVKIEFGAIQDESIYFASPDNLRVVATLLGGDTMIGLPPGRYAVASGQAMPINFISVQPGEIASLGAYTFRFESGQGDPVEIAVDDKLMALPPNTSIRFFSEQNPSLTSPAFDTVALDSDGPFILWRNADGSFPRQDGIQIHWQSQHPLIILGGTADLTLDLPSPAVITAVIEQGNQSSETVFDAMAGRAAFSVPAPDNLHGGVADIRLTVRRLADNFILEGESLNIPVHLPPGDIVFDLRASETGQTTVTLTWQSVTPSSVNIYRNQSARPINGTRPISETTTFQDIGLSARRSYQYQVCPVDELGLEGPCKIIIGTTLRQ